MTTSEQAYRVADREGEGWLRNGPDDTYTTFPRRDLAPMPYEQLAAERGPLRPIAAMESDDAKALAQAIADAGKKGTASLLAALNRTARTLIDDGASTAVFTAGRPGSWEADLLRGHILWLGEDLKPTRVDTTALETAEALLYKWTTGPVQVELADGLASILGNAAELAGGWGAITDRWLANDEALARWTAAYRR